MTYLQDYDTGIIVLFLFNYLDYFYILYDVFIVVS